MKTLRRLSIAALFALGLSNAVALSPPVVPALPDTPRLTSYTIAGTTCTCAVNFALYGNANLADYQDWVEVFLNGVQVAYNDPTYGWTITSPTGALASIARPITDAVLTFTNVQTGTVEIVGASRPARLSQWSENQGVSARNLNVAFTGIVAQLREVWDKINDVSGRDLKSQPGNTMGLLPLPAACQGMILGFDSTGLNPLCYQPSAVGALPNPLVIDGNAMTFPGVTATIVSQQMFGANTLAAASNPLDAALGLVSYNNLVADIPAASLANAKLTSSSMTFGGQGVSLGASATMQGNGAKLQAATGSTVPGDCAKYDANGNVIDSGSPCASNSIVPNEISGNIPSAIGGTNTTAVVTISPGVVSDSTTTTLFKGLGYSWAVANGNAVNGYQGGATLPNSSTIHFFLCDGVNGVTSFASLSATSPVCPANYNTYFRRIFSIVTNASGALIPYTAIESEGGSIIAWLTTQTLDVSTTAQGTTRILYTLNVPQGIKVSPITRWIDNNNSNSLIITSGDETDVAPSPVGGTTAPLSDFQLGTSGYGPIPTPLLTTNISGQVGVRGSVASTALYETTRGFKDFRRS